VALEFLDFLARAGGGRRRDGQKRGENRAANQSTSDHSDGPPDRETCAPMVGSSLFMVLLRGKPPGLRGTSRPARPRPAWRSAHKKLLAGRKMHAAIALPAGFVGLGTLRPLFAVADGLQPVAGDAELCQEILRGAAAAIAQAQVVFRRSTFIAVSLDDDRGVREVRENRLDCRGIASQDVASIPTDIALVVVEIGVLNVRHQPLLDGRR